jgi:hypothetical protein
MMKQLLALGKGLKFWLMSLSLRPLVRWRPLQQVEDGYSVVIACMSTLPEIAMANINLISRMNLPELKELILVFDVPKSQFEQYEQFQAAAQNLPIRFMWYTPIQSWIAKFWDWGWVYSWLSWTQAIATVKTRYVLIHDLDAMPISPDFFEDLYGIAKENQAFCQGIRSYVGNNGIRLEDGCVRTFEMVLDAQQMRQQFTPIEGFTKAGVIDNRVVIYDTFLKMQRLVGNCQVEEVPESNFVHPSQLISQYTDWKRGRKTKSDKGNHSSLPLLPIYLYLGGNEATLTSILQILEAGRLDGVIPIEEGTLDFSKISADHWQWLKSQAQQLEYAYAGTIRPLVQHYLNSMDKVFHQQKASVS